MVILSQFLKQVAKIGQIDEKIKQPNYKILALSIFVPDCIYKFRPIFIFHP